MGSPKDLASKLIELPPALEELPESDQLKLIRKLDRRQKELASQLKLEQSARKHAEDELETLTDFEELVDDTRGKFTDKQYVPKIAKRGGNATAVLCLTDWHCEENIDPAVVNGLNEYNLEICDRRMETCWNKYLRMLEFANHFSKIKNVVLWLGGDLINGYIHEELQEGNFLGPAEAILYAQDHVHRGIQLLLKETNYNVTVVTNYGNHGRSTAKRRISTGYKSSWEWLCFNNLAGNYRGEPRVDWRICKGYHNLVDIQGYLVRFHHGDSIRYQGGSGGITIPVNKAINDWNKAIKADFDCFGHYHTYMRAWNFLSVGCGCGHNAYAIEIKAAYQPPTQAMFVVDREYGVVYDLPVFVEKPRC